MSQFNWTGVRDVISAALAAVPGISIVQDFPRLERDKQPARWRSLMTDRHGINAWTVAREAVRTSFMTSKQVATFTDVLLVGLLQHNDETRSQDVFDELVDTVLEKLFSKYALDRLIDIQGPAMLRLQELRQVGDIVVHYAEVVFTIQQTINVT